MNEEQQVREAFVAATGLCEAHNVHNCPGCSISGQPVEGAFVIGRQGERLPVLETTPGLPVEVVERVDAMTMRYQARLDNIQRVVDNLERENARLRALLAEKEEK